MKDNRVSRRRSAEPDSGYENFLRYLDVVLTYAGLSSLERELVRVEDTARPEIGDVSVQGGLPGHAVLVAIEFHRTLQTHRGLRAT